MAEFSANAVQTINPGESIIFTNTILGCNRGLVRHANGTGNFILSGGPVAPGRNCNKLVPQYNARFGGNIAIAEGGTAGPISLAFAIDGTTIPYTEMILTPNAVGDFSCVFKESCIPVWLGCCQTLSIRNTSDQPIQAQNVVLDIDANRR